MNPVSVLTSGKITSDHIGKTVYLSNSAITCQEWIIADVNHDGTSGTVDLVCKHCYYGELSTKNGVQFDQTSNYYAASSLYNNTHNKVSYFTDDVKNAMKTINFISGSETLQDKIKIPSLTEVGCNKNSYCTPAQEGTIYPLFGNTQSSPNNLAIFTDCDGTTRKYWTRTARPDTTNMIMCVDKTGASTFSTTGGYYSNTDYPCAIYIIRF